MPSPILTALESSEALTPTQGAKRIFQAIYKEQNKESISEDIPKIRVSDLISKMAFYYEKIRNSVDYKEEYLLRKGAIARILKRQILSVIGSGEEDAQKVSKHLIIELIRAGYLANNTLPETKIDEIAVIIDKYIRLKNYSLEHVIDVNLFSKKSKNEIEGKTDVANWILGMASSEIEENLNQNKATEMIVGHMYEVLNNDIKLPADLPYENDLSIQIYLSVYRNFLKLDDMDVLSYILLRYYYNNWETANDEDIKKIAANINDLKFAINEQLKHPLKPQLNKTIHKYTVYYTILRDVVEDDPKKVYEALKSDPKAFSRHIKKACLKRYKEAKSKLWRSAVRSIIYILLTKSLLVFLEIPLSRFFGEEINPISLAINIGFPALILFVSVAISKIPEDDNTAQIVKGIEEIVFEEKKKRKPITLKRPAQRGAIIQTVFNIFYSITFLISFGVVIWILSVLQFGWVSMIIFLFFLAFVSFFIIRIRRGPKYLVVTETKESVISFLLQFIYIPVIATGKWLSNKFSKINVFVFILDFIIEAPFKVFVEITEEWTKYLKERKDNIS